MENNYLTQTSEKDGKWKRNSIDMVPEEKKKKRKKTLLWLGISDASVEITIVMSNKM